MRINEPINDFRPICDTAENGFVFIICYSDAADLF